MINYYEILGLEATAGITEIKAAFRRLAKQFHPDMNPAGIEHFQKILKAYETLSDPSTKVSYDYKLQYHLGEKTGSAQNKSTTKNWKFDERELKRRQYYNEHIKKYAKTTETYIKETADKKRYNEFKYILFATPLAVALFLLIMHLANPRNAHLHKSNNKTSQNAAKTAALKNGDTPYDYYFGTPQYDTTANRTLSVKNLTGLEVIFNLENKTGFVRSLYIEKDYAALIQQLPPGELLFKFCSGSGFDPKTKPDPNISGVFSRNLKYYKSIKTIHSDSINDLTLTPGENGSYRETTEKIFFNQ